MYKDSRLAGKAGTPSDQRCPPTQIHSWLLHLWWPSCVDFTKSFRASGHRPVQPLGHPAEVRNREEGEDRVLISCPGCIPARSPQRALSLDPVLTCSEWPAAHVPPATCCTALPAPHHEGLGVTGGMPLKPHRGHCPFHRGPPTPPPLWIKPHPVTLVEAPSSFRLGPQLTLDTNSP